MRIGSGGGYGDVTAVTAGTNLSGGGSADAITLALATNLALEGRLSLKRITASLTGNQNNWNPTGFSECAVLDLTSVSAGPFTITGFDSTGSAVGRLLILFNNGGQTLTLVNESASSSVGNKLKLKGGVNRNIGNYGAAGFVWDGTLWVQLFVSSRFEAELYSLGALHVDGVSDLIGAVTHYGATTLGDATSDPTTIKGNLDHDGNQVGFYGTTPINKQTGVAVDAASIHAALVALGLIAA